MTLPKYIVTLSLDDGIKKSTIKQAEIFERFGLKGCFNVVARAHEPGFKFPNSPEMPGMFADFGLYNELVARGHEVAPHGYEHLNKRNMPFEEAKASILRCLDVFDQKLKGFDAKKSVFNFPYNAVTPELLEWVPTVVRATRGGGIEHGINPLPTRETTVIKTTGHGPENCDAHLKGCVDALLAQDSGWLMYCGHGLDEEGWGPMSGAYLERLLGELVERPDVKVWPAGQAFAHLGL
jgi:peptidoglycan/xylan/chitin deacetylase (PgdA/CDA1 family)